MADCWPHEHFACEAQTHWSSRPQQVVGLVMMEYIFKRFSDKPTMKAVRFVLMRELSLDVGGH
jgi:hypothetical protein